MAQAFIYHDCVSYILPSWGSFPYITALRSNLMESGTITLGEFSGNCLDREGREEENCLLYLACHNLMHTTSTSYRQFMMLDCLYILQRWIQRIGTSEKVERVVSTFCNICWGKRIIFVFTRSAKISVLNNNKNNNCYNVFLSQKVIISTVSYTDVCNFKESTDVGREGLTMRCIFELDQVWQMYARDT